MCDFIGRGSISYEEPSQVRAPHSYEKTLAECRRCVQLLRPQLSPTPEGAPLSIHLVSTRLCRVRWKGKQAFKQIHKPALCLLPLCSWAECFLVPYPCYRIFIPCCWKIAARSNAG